MNSNKRTFERRDLLSGCGHFGSRAGINELIELRWITIGTYPHHYLF
jgi:hypothetical protein